MAKPTIYENDSDKIGFAVSYLTGAAATHYNNLLKQEEAGIPVPALYNKYWTAGGVDNLICATNAAHSRGGNSGFGMYNPMAPSNPQNSNPQQGSNSNNPQQAGGQQDNKYWTAGGVDNLICATNAAHSRGGNSGFGMYNPMAPSNPQNSNPQQGSNSNNPQQAGGQQGRNQGNWTTRQRGAAAWDSNVNSDNISGTVYGQSEDFASASSQNGNSGESLENQGENNGVSKNPGDEEFLRAI
ncbi:hypothetical protein GYMLUDRAFT_241872 [Collybiopsis luxurians FD-317 M1]|uniref:Uncharacterized protein n=1 Tax=Collybiopsis luxurians FD-317 M1 TaxID=944289 RepID=A0A0D0BHB6_9AGAR|nr:hypothetical protein GYMLUDRAFT_241872 [Collybiopsis luxurians FD-317 M1]